MATLDWAHDYFERGYAQRWDLRAPSDQTRLEADGLWDQLHLSTNARVLDLACGHGRYALALARRGASVVGVDFAEALLTRAIGLTDALGIPVHWLHGDIHRLPFRSMSFSAALLLDAFGFAETDAENEAVLTEARRVLSAGGRFGLKVVNGGPIIAAFRHIDREERDGVAVSISRALALEPARMIEKVTVTGVRGSGEYERRQRLYQVDELCDALERAGFSTVRVFASPGGAEFDPATSSAMWAFAETWIRPTRQA